MLTVWDSTAAMPQNEGLLYSWNGYIETSNTFSLLQYIEAHDESMRSKYLAWIHDLGESLIDTKRLIDYLAVEDGFSYWWMTLFVEKSPWKQPAIMDAIRLLALEEIIAKQNPIKLRLVSGNPNLNKVLCNFCKTLGIDYQWQLVAKNAPEKWQVKNVYSHFPYTVKAILSMARYVSQRWKMKSAKRIKWFGGSQSIFICSYFFHLDTQYLKKGQFYSKYWEGLHTLLKTLGFSENWLQLYYAHDIIPDTTTATEKINTFNQQHNIQTAHSFLDSYLNWTIVLNVLKQFFILIAKSNRLKEIIPAFSPKGSHMSFWPIMQKDWNESFFGPVAINNLLFIELFNSALSSLPHQKKGLFLYEGQNWEKPFIHAWHKYGHGELIGVAHSTIRYWDLRYFFDLRTVRSSNPHSLPQADLIAMNGKASVNAYLNSNYPKEKIVECEALRYVNLHQLQTKRSPVKVKEGLLKVLILGDYMPAGTINMLEILEEAMEKLLIGVNLTLKPHPNYIVEGKKYPTLNLTIVRDPLENILHNFDIVISSNMTSASVDAYIAGLPVVVMLDELDLNFSPLRGHKSVYFVSTPDELVNALQLKDPSLSSPRDSNELFFLDPALPRWKNLLAS